MGSSNHGDKSILIAEEKTIGAIGELISLLVISANDSLLVLMMLLFLGAAVGRLVDHRVGLSAHLLGKQNSLFDQNVPDVCD